MKYFYHPDRTEPQRPETIFVFGSNLAGIHGAGAAKLAREKYGAITMVHIGMSGRSYAIPTKDYLINSLPLSIIEEYVKLFLSFAKKSQSSKFFTTRIGCGLAGYKDSDIAPMFKGGSLNISFPEEWKVFLEGSK